MASREMAYSSGSRIDALNADRERRPVSPAMRELDRTLAGLEQRLMELEQEQPTPRHHADDTIAGLAAIADSLRDLDRRRDRLDDRALPAEKASDKIPPAFSAIEERIEKRLTEFAERIDAAVLRQNSDLLFQKLGELSQRIDVLACGQALPDRVADQLAHQINILAKQVARVTDSLSLSDYHNMETRLEAIGEKLDAADRRAREPHPAVLDTINHRFTELTERLDAHHSRREINGDAIRNLESQIEDIARRLAEPAAEMNRIAPRLEQIEHIVRANREATEDAVARQLAAAIQSLTHERDAQNSKSFETMQDMLVGIADRLSRLEQEIGDRPLRSQQATMPSVPAGRTSLFGVITRAMRDHRPEKAHAVEDNAPRSEDEANEMPVVEALVRETPQERTRFGGDHMPDLQSILKRVREERRQREEYLDAAQSDADKPKNATDTVWQPPGKPFLMAIGAAMMLTMAGLQIGSAFLKQ